MDSAVLRIRELRTYFFTKSGVVKAADGISFDLREGETLCLVGESGCGKTVTALSILGLVDSPPGRTVGGEIWYRQEDLLHSSPARLRAIRGNNIAMIFQDPQSSLNPIFTVGDQIAEQIRLHRRLGKGEAWDLAVSLMDQVGIPQARQRAGEYPHQFSGGMNQRVLIAAALSCDPEVIIADEPTTALDVTIKAQILDILKRLTEERRMSLLFITHDLGVVAEIADRIVVMYGGRLAESGTSADIFDNPKHPYTWGLIKCLPDMSQDQDRLTPIPGMIPSLIDPPQSCIFHPRCPRGMPVCTREMPPQITISGEHTVVCQLYKQSSGTNE